MLYPLTFEPIFQKRVWGGRRLETLFNKPHPPGQLIGESWEISDRPDAISVITNGPFAGHDLRWLMENHADELLEDAYQTHPLHVEFVEKIFKTCCERVVVYDFES